MNPECARWLVCENVSMEQWQIDIKINVYFICDDMFLHTKPNTKHMLCSCFGLDRGKNGVWPFMDIILSLGHKSLNHFIFYKLQLI